MIKDPAAINYGNMCVRERERALERHREIVRKQHKSDKFKEVGCIWLIIFKN